MGKHKNVIDKGKILIVEDNEAMKMLLERILRAGGYQVLTATSSASALSKYEVNGFVYVLTDVDLDDGPSGLDFARTLKAMDPHVKILVMSGGNYRDEVGGLGVFLQKPFTPSELWLALGKIN